MQSTRELILPPLVNHRAVEVYELELPSGERVTRSLSDLADLTELEQLTIDAPALPDTSRS